MIVESDTSAFIFRLKVNADVSITVIMTSEPPPAGVSRERRAHIQPVRAQSLVVALDYFIVGSGSNGYPW
jgi:hypothetical protein